MCSEARSPLLLEPSQITSGMADVLTLGQAHFAANCLYAVVKLGVPDVIGDGRLTAPEIVAKLPGRPNEEVLLRCLRLLALKGIFLESASPSGECAFSLTAGGALLQTGLEQPSMACAVQHWLEKPTWSAWAEVPDLVAGAPAVPTPYERANGMHVFDYYQAHPESANPFNEFLHDVSKGEEPFVVQHVGWEKLVGKTVVDVSDSLNSAMGAVVAKFPGIKVKNVACPHGGTLDPSTIPAADCIFMKHVMHHWDDESCVRVLKACREALAEDGQVVICEAVLPEAGAMCPAYAAAVHLDALMLVAGGKERTKKQWEALATASGFRLKEVKNTPHPAVKIIVYVKGVQ